MRALLIVAMVVGTAVADDRTIRGVVTERGSPKPIAGASVLTERGGHAVTDADGYFALAVEPAERDLTIIATGYLTRTVRIADGVIHVELQPASGGEVIEIRGKAPEETKPLSYQLSVDEIRAIPGAGNDILRAATALPGVARIPFSFGGLVLRGMSPRDSAVELDGVDVPLAFHFGGVTSFYPAGMLADLQLTPGGYDASHGRAQGGLVTLTTREPRTDRWRMGGSIGLFDSSVQAEGPLPGGGGILVGLRRSYFDTIAAPFVDDDIPLPSYWDLQLRTTWGDARRGGRITPMVFGSIDRVASSEISLTSLFVRVAVPYLRQWGTSTLRVVPWLGTNRLTLVEYADPHVPDDREQSFSRPVYPGGLRAEVLRDHAWGHLRAGLDVSSGYVARTQVNVIGRDGPQASQNGTSTVSWVDAGLWAELRWKLDGERFAIKPGLRVDAYGIAGGELVVDPRLNIHQKLTDRITLRQAIGRYHQPPTPADVDDVDGNPALRSSYVDQLSLGADSELPESVLASVTGFFNYGRSLGVEVRNPRPGSDLPEPNLGGLGPTFQLLLEKQLGFPIYRENRGRARSYGAELSLKRNAGAWFSLLSYTLQRSQRTDDPRLGRGWRPFELDQRHNLQVATSVQLPNWRFGARFQLVTGNPYSPTRTMIINGQPIIAPDPWAGRLPVFISLDVRADRRWHRCWGDAVLFLDIQNATNRTNVEGRDFDDVLGVDTDIKGLPIIPFIGVEFLPLN